jgi:hypothetical protein
VQGIHGQEEVGEEYEAVEYQIDWGIVQNSDGGRLSIHELQVDWWKHFNIAGMELNILLQYYEWEWDSHYILGHELVSAGRERSRQDWIAAGRDIT